jgi:uncharacterized protein with FMN-binding domain
MKNRLHPNSRLLSIILMICGIYIGLNSCAGTEKTVIPAQELKPIRLLKPQMDGGRPLMQVLKDRKSSRSFSTKKLPNQVLSNMLWAAFGINRAESGKRTAPSALDWQETDIYMATEDGLYIYDAKAHMLDPVLAGDIRAETSYFIQPFVKDAPVNLIYVADYSKTGLWGRLMSAEQRDMFSAAATGFISQNVYLFCASEGLATVVRGLVDRSALRKVMNLRPEQKITLAQSVGYPEEKAASKPVIDFSSIPDGTFYGDVALENLTYKVGVTVKEHRITNIEILKIGNTEYEEEAKGVIIRVLRAQSTDVDTVSGGTISSKALLKAIENALLNSISQ